MSRYRNSNGKDPKFTALGRFLQTVCDPIEAERYLRGMDERKHFASTPQVVIAYRKTVDPMSVSNSGSMALTSISEEFASALQPMTVAPKILAGQATELPFRRLVRIGDTVGNATTVVEGDPMPVSSATFAQPVYLEVRKIGAMVVIDKELARFADTAAEQLLVQTVAKPVAKALDVALLDPNTSSSLTENARTFTSAGSSTANIVSDIDAMVQQFVSDSTLNDPVLVMRKSTAFTMRTKLTAAGVPQFPNLTLDGGEALGLPVVTSENAPQALILIDRSQILFADGGAEFSAANYASIQMETSPGSGAQQSVSLFQNNLRALMAQRWVNFTLKHAADSSPHYGLGVAITPIGW